jgi:hypothetical protein
MRKSYVLFEWLCEKRNGSVVPTRNTLLLMRTNIYDVSVHRVDCGFTGFGMFDETIAGEEGVWLRDRESGEKEGIVYHYYGGESLIEKLIGSKNRNRDLWKIELEMRAHHYD